MSHGQGWRFLLLGVHLERAQRIARLLDVCFGDPAAPEVLTEHLAQMAVLRMACALEPYLRVYTAEINPLYVLQFLLFDEDFPRSIRFSTSRIEDYLDRLAPPGLAPSRVAPERLAGRLKARLEFADMDETLAPGAILSGVVAECLAHSPRHLRDLHRLSARAEIAVVTAMLFEIRHLTQYHYAEPVRASVMELWAQPQKSPRQRLISFELEIEPSAQLFSYVDAFGNAVYHFDVPQPHDRLAIESRAAVETEAPPPLPDQLDMGEWERMRSQFVLGECFDFLQPHGFAIQTPALAAFIEKHDLDRLRRVDPLTAVRTLCETVYAAFDYEAGVTAADSPIDEALAHGRGVCQDFAHIMIAICRSWGIPARYVSGYIFTDRSEASDRSNPDATHAWVEVYLPSLRWVGFDPTNNVVAGERHINRGGRAATIMTCRPRAGCSRATPKAS